MFNNIFSWLMGLFGFGQDPQPPSTTVGNHNSIPETNNPQHQHLDLPVVHVNEPFGTSSFDQMPVVQSFMATTDQKTLTKEDIILRVLDIEKGYVNDPKDSGGETNFGITIMVAHQHEKMLRRDFGWNGKMIDLTKPMAIHIYEENYWKPLRLDTIIKTSPFLADKLFDISVNIGMRRAGEWLQRALNAFNREQRDYLDVTEDGYVGDRTLEALNGLIRHRGKKDAVDRLIMALIVLQGYHYLEISRKYPKNETFVWGWYARLMKHLDSYFK